MRPHSWHTSCAYVLQQHLHCSSSYHQIKSCFLQACYMGIVHIFPTILCGLKILVMPLIPKKKPPKTSRVGSGIVGVKSLQNVITQSCKILCNLQVGVQFPDSMNAQYNLNSAQIPRLHICLYVSQVIFKSCLRVFNIL